MVSSVQWEKQPPFPELMGRSKLLWGTNSKMSEGPASLSSPGSWEVGSRAERPWTELTFTKCLEPGGQG